MTLSPGDRVPFWTAVDLDRRFHSADGQAGRACVLVIGREERLLRAFAAAASGFAACDCDILVMLPFAAIPMLYREGEAATAGLPVRLHRDDPFAAAGGGVPVLVVDRSGRLAMVADAATRAPADLVGAALAVACAAQASPVPRAPVLVLPGLLDAALCRDIVAGFAAAATFESPVSGIGADGRAADRIDHDRKRRRDWLLDPETPLHARVVAALAHRCVPELDRAFQHQVAHGDRIIVARYDSGAGHFRRHRDNAAPAVAFRQFALSVNLNTGAFEGGDLRFPEYDATPLRPGRGEGVVFSASLLHEVTDVTAGCRYALLTFLHDAAAERRRMAPAREAA